VVYEWRNPRTYLKTKFKVTEIIEQIGLLEIEISRSIPWG
jgi:hypothetical protein